MKTPEERLNDAILVATDLVAELLDLLPRLPEVEPTLAAALREARETRQLLLQARDRVREFAEEVAAHVRHHHD